MLPRPTPSRRGGPFRAHSERLEPRVLLAANPPIALYPGDYQFFTDATLQTPGLVGSYVAQDLVQDRGDTDWRVSQAITGQRVDTGFGDPLNIGTSFQWGRGSDVNMPGGDAFAWKSFSVQWDGFVDIRSPHTSVDVTTHSGVRVRVDANKDGQFDDTPAELAAGEWGTTHYVTDTITAPLAPGVYPVRMQFQSGDLINTFQVRPRLAPAVRVAYLVPSNRTPQPGAAAALQDALKLGQAFFREQMDRYGFGPKTFLYETEADGVTPKVYTVGLADRDSALRSGDVWGNVLRSAGNAGVWNFVNGEDWLYVAEIHSESSNGAVTADISLGSSNGSGLDGGTALTTGVSLPWLAPGAIYDDRNYDGLVVPGIGPYPLHYGVTTPAYNGTTVSDLSSGSHGAFIHELTHGFGLPHDFVNDDVPHGDLMGNGFRAFRGWVSPFNARGKDITLGYAEALMLNNSPYFNPDRPSPEANPPSARITTPAGQATLVNGQLEIHFTASDDSGLSAALLLKNGETIGAMPLSGNTFDGSFLTPYVSGSPNYTVLVYDVYNNRAPRDVQLTPRSGQNRAPQPYVMLSSSTVRVNQPITLNAGRSSDPDGNAFTVEWDLGDGNFTAPVTSRTLTTSFPDVGARLVRARLTDNRGGQSLSVPIAVRVLPPGPALSGVTVNDGAAQRSSVGSVTLTFDRPVALGPTAVSLVRRDAPGGVTALVSNPSGDARTYVLSFTGDGLDGTSLPDGVYDLRLRSNAITAAELFSTPLEGGDRTLTLTRLSGDLNGDRAVNALDVALMRRSLGSAAGDASYRTWLDFDNNARIDATDLAALRAVLNHRLTG